MERAPRRLSAVFDRDQPILCLCLAQARTPDIVLIAAASGFDAVYVDLQHTVTSLETTSVLCSVALGSGLVPLVRVPSLDAPTITRVLDGGALGVIVPDVRTAEQAAMVVDACRFPPLGNRSLYVTSPVTGYESRPMDHHRERLDAEVIVVPQIESARGVEQADEIAGTDGVDMVLVGAYDLSVDLGVAGEVSHRLVRDALVAVADACTARGCRFGVAGVDDAGLLAELLDRGLGFISAGTDTGLLRRGATEQVGELRELIGRTDPDPDRPRRESGDPA